MFDIYSSDDYDDYYGDNGDDGDDYISEEYGVSSKR